jgi:hypothetical protein
MGRFLMPNSVARTFPRMERFLTVTSRPAQKRGQLVTGHATFSAAVVGGLWITLNNKNIVATKQRLSNIGAERYEDVTIKVEAANQVLNNLDQHIASKTSSVQQLVRSRYQLKSVYCLSRLQFASPL